MTCRLQRETSNIPGDSCSGVSLFLGYFLDLLLCCVKTCNSIEIYFVYLKNMIIANCIKLHAIFDSQYNTLLDLCESQDLI